VVGGLAMSDIRGMLNLNPPELRGHVRHRQQVRELVVVSVLVALALGLGTALLALQLARQRQVATMVDHALEELGPTAKEIQQKSRSVQLVSAVLQGRRQLAATLVGVFDQTPSSVTLEGLTFERSRREVAVKGHAASTQAVLEYMKQLEAVEGVRRVDLKHSTQRSAPAGERTSFELLLHQP
jgi:Tfp pilus assembly protein PilN